MICQTEVSTATFLDRTRQIKTSLNRNKTFQGLLTTWLFIIVLFINEPFIRGTFYQVTNLGQKWLTSQQPPELWRNVFHRCGVYKGETTVEIERDGFYVRLRIPRASQSPPDGERSDRLIGPEVRHLRVSGRFTCIYGGNGYPMVVGK